MIDQVITKSTFILSSVSSGRKYIVGFIAILGLFACLSFTLIWNNETKQSSRSEVPDMYDGVMCASAQSYQSQISLEDIYISTHPLAPKLETNWQTNLAITSTSKEAKEFFNQGLLNIYAFNHAEADRSFKEAIRQDPNCAMCYWGVALGLGPNINIPMNEADK